MTLRKLGRLIAQSLRRNLRDLALSSIGIVVGIGTLLLFTALGAGIKSVVLEDVFVVRQLEVVPKRVDVGTMGQLLGGGEEAGLGDQTVDKLRKIQGVEAAYPKMKLTFPSSVRGGKNLVGRDLVAEMVGDGIPPRLVDDQRVGGKLAFRDWEAERSCSSAEDCPGGFRCEEGTCAPQSCSGADSDVCPDPARCDKTANQCRMPIPVIASPQLLEIYNGNLRTAVGGSTGNMPGLPELSAEQLVGFEFTAIFGKSYLGKSASDEPIRRTMRLVGFSERAIRLGVTMPIGYVERLNRRFGGGSGDPSYHSIVLETASNDDVARVARTVRQDFDDLEMSDDYENAQRASLLIMIITLVFNLIGLVILTISAVNIMHTLLMIILERRREIGLMRAVGASRMDIRLLVFGESTVVGLVGGAAGIGVAWVAMRVIDLLFNTQLGDFPFKPESLFAVEPWMLAASLGVSLLFCWLGALLPAFRASDIDPAEALTGR